MKGYIKKLGLSLLSLGRVIRRSRYVKITSKQSTHSEQCFVLGNGPSLRNDLELWDGNQSLGDVWCVNNFAETHLYEKLRPTYYVLADPDYWSDSSSENFRLNRERLFSEIIKKTEWPLIILAPFDARKHLKKYFFDNSFIKVEFYNNVPVMGFDVLNRLFYRLNIGLPPVQNVLVAALFLAVRRGYKEIVLLGADHSWHETLTLDDTNRVCHRDRHFYGGAPKLTPFYLDGSENETFTIPQILIAFARMFEGYWEIRRYADYLGIEIYNASSITYIDALKRIKVEDVFNEKHLAGSVKADRNMS
ncbi:MAG: DUF115 domain-containing protein [Gallionella sp.]|nr:DUF115 domain-containing protein [Gallionella sp.]